MVGSFHGIKYKINKACIYYVLMEQVAHRIYEYPTWSFPSEWLPEPVVTKLEIKSTLERMPAYTAKALGKPLGITVVAAA